MTQSEFTAFYPQFAGFTPAIVMTTYIAQANARFSSFTPEDAEEARRLYVAHRLTLYAMSFPGEASSASSIVAAPHSGDGSFQMTSPPTEFPPQAALGGSPFMGADRVHWAGKTWRVVRVRNWQSFGYYQAYAVLMHESD